MAILIIDSSDNNFLNIILKLVKKFKGAKAELIDDVNIDNVEIVDDDLLANEIDAGLRSGIASKETSKDFLNSLVK